MRREKRDDPQWRLASIREAREAAHGDWHKLTNLWSIQNDLDWLLAVAELHFAVSPAPDPGAGLREATVQPDNAYDGLYQESGLAGAAPSAEPPETT